MRGFPRRRHTIRSPGHLFVFVAFAPVLQRELLFLSKYKCEFPLSIVVIQFGQIPKNIHILKKRISLQKQPNGELVGGFLLILIQT